jgi:hypothetical protein
MLWEDTFYESGESIADRIKQTIPLVSPQIVADLAIEAREKFKLRHVPLLIVREMARLNTHKHFVSSTLAKVIQRPDELTEALAIYWEDGKHPISAQFKKGLAEAFTKFNEYSLAKYNRDATIKLRDVLFLCHAKPKDAAQEDLWKRLIKGELQIPDTWEVEISRNRNNAQSWERLLQEEKLGGLALLRNLRNMLSANVDTQLIRKALLSMKAERILPFRFISAAKYAPNLESELEEAMLKCLNRQEKLPGKTILVVDGSGSMFGTPVSAKSEIDRFEAATALAILARELCEECAIIVFSSTAAYVPPRRGFALRDVLYKYAERDCTNTQLAIDLANCNNYDRIIVFTDEQSHTNVYPSLYGAKSYIVNIAPYKNGIGYGDWQHIDGWSEAILSYIQEFERIK